MSTISETKIALEVYLQNPSKETDVLIGHLEKLQNAEMTLQMLQQTEIGRIVTQLKKSLRDDEKALNLVNQILASWKDLATREAKKRKRENGEGSTDNLEPPTPEKKSKITENETPAKKMDLKPAEPSKPASTGPASTLGLPMHSLRKDFSVRMAESLKSVPQEVLDKLPRSVADTAILVERATFDLCKDANDNYKSHLRLINYHIKQNIYVRERIALGILTPEVLATMTTDDFVSDEQKAAAARIVYEVSEARKPLALEANCSTEPCPKCHSGRVHVTQAQTRSADEPMTQFFTCLDCGKKWKK